MSAFGLARVAVRAGSGKTGVIGDTRGLPPGSEWVSLDLGAFPPGTLADRLREHFGEPEAVETVRKLIAPPVRAGQDPERANVETVGSMSDEESSGSTLSDESDPASRVVELEEWYYRVAPEQDERPTDWLVFEVHDQVVHASRVQTAGPGKSSEAPGDGEGMVAIALDGAALTDALMEATGDEGGIATDGSDDESLAPPETETTLASQPVLEPEPVPELETASESESEPEPETSGEHVPVFEMEPEREPEVVQGAESLPGDSLALARQRAASRPLRPGRWRELDDEFPDAPAFDDLVMSVLSEVRRPER